VAHAQRTPQLLTLDFNYVQPATYKIGTK